MSLFERDDPKRADSSDDAQHTAFAPGVSNADAEESAAHIARMVRRTADRLAEPSPSCVAGPDVTPVRRPATPAASVAQPVAQPDTAPAGHTMRHPSRRTVVAAGAVAAVLIGGAAALSHPTGSEAGPTSPTPGGSGTSLPAGYAVQVTDVITDCAGHARGRAKASFETHNCVNATRSLATGRVSGRPALFVVSRVQMASAELAASVKQILDGSGTGNLNDLLREGKTFAGAPDRMPISGYVSVQTAEVVTVAEAGFADGGRSAGTDAALRAAAALVAGQVGAPG